MMTGYQIFLNNQHQYLQISMTANSPWNDFNFILRQNKQDGNILIAPKEDIKILCLFKNDILSWFCEFYTAEEWYLGLQWVFILNCIPHR